MKEFWNTIQLIFTAVGGWLGYFLGGVDVVHDNLEAAVLLIVAVSVLPMVFEFVRHRSATRTAIEEVEEVVDDVRDGTL